MSAKAIELMDETGGWSLVQPPSTVFANQIESLLRNHPLSDEYLSNLSLPETLSHIQVMASTEFACKVAASITDGSEERVGAIGTTLRDLVERVSTILEPYRAMARLQESLSAGADAEGRLSESELSAAASHNGEPPGPTMSRTSQRELWSIACEDNSSRLTILLAEQVRSFNHAPPAADTNRTPPAYAEFCRKVLTPKLLASCAHEVQQCIKPTSLSLTGLDQHAVVQLLDDHTYQLFGKLVAWTFQNALSGLDSIPSLQRALFLSAAYVVKWCRPLEKDDPTLIRTAWKAAVLNREGSRHLSTASASYCDFPSSAS